jgi:hypothetical protein
LDYIPKYFSDLIEDFFKSPKRPAILGMTLIGTQIAIKEEWIGEIHV